AGFDSFLEPEQPKTGGRRILLLLALLAALGGAGWWTYSYLSAAEGRKPEAATASVGDTPADQAVEKQATKPEAPARDLSSSQAAAPSASVPEGPPENASAVPAPAAITAD